MPGMFKLSPTVFRLSCSTVSPARAFSCGIRALSARTRSPRAISLAESLTSNPRFVFMPRSIASWSVSANGVDDGTPVGTLPWNWFC